MLYIDAQDQLNTYCERARQAAYICVDTEFLRETTYYAKLCLIQIAFACDKNDGSNVAIIDVLAPDLNIEPVLDIFRDTSIVKVFHAARQDLEIFFQDYGVLPAPFFDTQIAAMVDGYGDQVGYETLVRSVVKGKIDKTSRFTDWSRRPLSEAQKKYAADDVIYLCGVYEFLEQELNRNGRIEWVREEFAALLDPALYQIPADEAWKRVRARSNSPRFLALVKELARFRESYARENNIPRTRVFKDDALLEAAAQKPKDAAALKKLRLWRNGVKADIAAGVVEAIAAVEEMDPKSFPQAPKKDNMSQVDTSIVDLLRVYLKAQSEKNEVASRLICSSAELEEFAANPDAVSPLNQGWRRKVFGADAKKIIQGQAGLMADGKYVKLVNLNEL